MLKKVLLFFQLLAILFIESCVCDPWEIYHFRHLSNNKYDIISINESINDESEYVNFYLDNILYSARMIYTDNVLRISISCYSKIKDRKIIINKLSISNSYGVFVDIEENLSFLDPIVIRNTRKNDDFYKGSKTFIYNDTIKFKNKEIINLIVSITDSEKLKHSEISFPFLTDKKSGIFRLLIAV